jgi:ElaB/YqjD/DUF883 family membrane-anchored ribosome-binding protein
LKFASISDFRHTIIIQGKKYLVGPGDVIESPTSLSYIFLQEVDEKTPTTVKNAFQGGRVHQQVSSLQKVNENIASTANSSIEQLKQKLDTFIEKHEKDLDDLTKQINEQFSSLETADLENKKADTKFKEDTNRRLGILKDAMRTMEDEVYGVADVPPKN